MSNIVIKGSTSGDVTLTVPAEAGTNTLTLPAATGTILTTNNFDLNGSELVLDADADTSITADTDDQIDFKIAGADDFRMTANTFTALSGSTISVPSGATIANAGTATGFGIMQTVAASDATLYSISVTNATSDHAGSIAYSITPTSASNKVKIDFTIPQVKHAQHAGLRVRLYRQINSGGYAHVTALSGTASSNKLAALFGNYDTNGDGNRSATTITGSIVDSPNTTNQVDYKFYFGAGDGSTTIFVNRTQNDSDSNFTSRTRTHVCLTEIE